MQLLLLVLVIIISPGSDAFVSVLYTDLYACAFETSLGEHTIENFVF